jgi:D-aminoacyl-tRNA deacylase
MRNVFLELINDTPRGFKVSLEVTHHSPTQFETPLFFAEIGSRERHWRDEEVCTFLVESILSGVISGSEAPVAIGFGGGHYCPRFTIKEEEIAFGHIAAKYALDLLNEDLIGQMVDKTLEGVEFAYLDSVKGYKRKKIEVALSSLGVPIR